MTTSAPDVSGPPGDAGDALAIALRDLLLRVQSTVLSDDQLADATASVRDLTQRLDGTPRLRWYERDSDSDADSYREHTLFHGRKSALAAPLVLEADDRNDGRLGLRGSVVLNRLYEGPPGSAHGGYLAGLFDAMLGDTQRLVPGSPAVTGRLSLRYRQRTPLDTPLVFRSWVETARGRRLIIKGTCEVEGSLTAEAEGLFVRLNPASFTEPRIAR